MDAISCYLQRDYVVSCFRFAFHLHLFWQMCDTCCIGVIAIDSNPDTGVILVHTGVSEAEAIWYELPLECKIMAFC